MKQYSRPKNLIMSTLLSQPEDLEEEWMLMGIMDGRIAQSPNSVLQLLHKPTMLKPLLHHQLWFNLAPALNTKHKVLTALAYANFVEQLAP